MIYFIFDNGRIVSGHVGERKIETLTDYAAIVEVQADGDELQMCCDILGRNMPKTRVYTFVGDNAKEIALNF